MKKNNEYLKIFDEFKSDIKQVSYDDSKKESMISSKNVRLPLIIDFDEVKDSYCRDFGENYVHKHGKDYNSLFKSVDCISYINEYDKILFIEFKNGSTRNIKRLKEKIKDSLHIFFEKTNKRFDFSRRNIYYIVVYNEDVEMNEDELFDKNYEDIVHTISSFESEDIFGENRVIKFGLDILQGTLVEKCFTFSKTEFIYFVNNKVIDVM